MKGFRTTEDDIKIKENAIEHKKQFEVEFNRFYCTKRYVEAFDLCVQHLSDIENKDFVKSKSKLAIEKLTDHIVLSDISRVDKDWVIDILIQLGHRHLTIKDDTIKIGDWGTKVLLTKVAKRISIIVQGSVLLSFFAVLFIMGGWILLMNACFEAELEPFLYLSICGILLGICLMKKAMLLPKKYIRELAASIVEEYYNR